MKQNNSTPILWIRLNTPLLSSEWGGNTQLDKIEGGVE
jgi:hypothetical protein